MVDLGLISDIFVLSLVFVGNMGFGASPLRTSVASIPAGDFFFVEFHFGGNTYLSLCFMIFLQNDYNLSSNRGTT